MNKCRSQTGIGRVRQKVACFFTFPERSPAMKKFSLFVLTASLLVLLSPHPVKSDTAATINTLRSFDYNKSTNLGNMEGYARDEANGFLNSEFKGKATEWVAQARAQWVSKKGADFLKPGFGRAIPTPWEQSPEYRTFLKSELTNRMKLEFPKEVDSFIRNKLLKSDGQKMDAQAARDMTKMVGEISERVMGDVEGIVNKSIDKWGSGDGFRLPLPSASPMGFLDSLSTDMASQMGRATKDGMKGFIDTKMFEQFGKGFAGKIEGQMDQAADKLESLQGTLDLAGNFDPNDMEGMLKSAMGDPPALPGLSPADFAGLLVPDQLVAKLAHDAKALDAAKIHLPNLNIPAPAYAGILLADAANHFGRCCGFLYFRPYEIARGIRLIKSAIWQMNSKGGGYMLLGGDLGGRGVLEGHGTDFDKDKLKKLEDAIAKMEKINDKTGGKEASAIVADAIKDMGDVKKDLDQAFLNMKTKSTTDQTQFANNLTQVQNQQKQDVQKAAEQTKVLNDCSNPLMNPAKCGFKPVAPVTNGLSTAMLGGTNGGGLNDLVSKASPQADASSKLDPVVLYSGEFKLDATDLKEKGLGIDFTFSRHYRSQKERLGPLGYNWTHNYDEKIIEDEGTGDLLQQIPAGEIYRYIKKGNDYQSPAGMFTVLKKVDEGYLVENENHELHHFNKKGQLVKIEDRFGNALRFEYGLSGEQIVLTRVVDTLGQAVEFSYDTEGLLTNITDSFGRKVVYTYDKERDLVAVRSPVSNDFPQGKTIRYRYSGGKLEPSLNHNITLIMDAKGQIYLRNEYGTEGFEKDRLIAQIFGDKESQKMTATYESINDKGGINDAATKTIVTDRNGIQHEYTHNSRGLRLSYRGDTYLYNENDQVVQHTSPGGREEIFVYDDKNTDRLAQNNLLEYRVVGTDKKGSTIRYTYDATNHLATSRTLVGKDPQGNEVTRREDYTYTPLGMPKEVKKGGLTTLYEYNPQGQLAGVTEENWRRSYFYDKQNLTQITESDGTQTRNIQLAYDTYGNVTDVTDPTGAKTHYWLNATNLVVQKQDALENKSYYKYDENNNLIEVTTENKGGVNLETLGYELGERYTFDSLDHLVKKEVQINRDSWAAETYTYDAGENLSQVTDLKGIKHGFAYDDHDRLIQETVGEEAVRKLSYDKEGQLMAETDGLGNKKTYQYDALARMTKFTDPVGTQLKIYYTPVGEIDTYQVLGSELNLLKEVHFAYDALGRRVREAEKKIGSQEWQDTTYVYEGRHLKDVKDSLGLIRTFAYDGFGELATMTDASGNAVNFTYDPRGLVTQKEIKKGLVSVVQRLTYDPLGRPSTQSDTEGNTTSWSYDSIGNLIKEVDPLNKETLFAYDGLGRLLTETKGERVRKLEWSPEGFSKFIDGGGKTTSYTYDARGRKKTETGPDGLVKQFDYDVMGKLSKLTTGDENYTYKYDVGGRLIERGSLSGAKQDYAYDGLGRLTQSVDSNDPSSPDDDVKTAFSYDSLNHLIKEASRGYVVQKDYDTRGRMSKIVYPSGEVVDRKFDEAGWLTEVKDGGQIIGSYDYALLGFPERETLGNGITRELSYDKLMQVVGENYSMERKKLSQMTYRYDALGRVVLKGNTGKWEVYDYNNLDQLARVGTAQNVNISGQGAIDNLKTTVWNASRSRREYAYDFEGQWQEILKTDGGKTTQTPIAQGEGYRYQQFGDEPMTYDARGNLIGYGEKLFEYDAWNRLIRVRDKANKIVASYLYDADNRRVQKKTETLTTDFVYDNWSLIEEYTDKQLYKLYIHGRSPDQPVAMKSGGELYYYHRDRMGSVIALSDSKGNLAGSYGYGEYGELTRQGPKLALADSKNPLSIPKILSPDFAYTGQYYDKESGLYYYKNRYYSPEIGHFLSQDPMGMVNGPNVYAYVTNDPLNWIDPMGTEKQDRGFWGTAWDYTLGNPHVQGGLQAFGGIIETTAGAALGVATSWTGIGAVAGGVVAVHGLDTTQAGLRKMWSGEDVDTLTSGGLQAVGVPRGWANGIDTTISIVGSLGAGVATAGVRAGAMVVPKALGEVGAVGEIGTEASETFYRGMSQADHAVLSKTGALPGTFETMISKSQAFASKYGDVLVEFQTKAGTTEALSQIGVRDVGALATKQFGDMPLVESGWKWTNAFFKTEGQQVNIGLGVGNALETFNENIISFKAILK